MLVCVFSVDLHFSLPSSLRFVFSDVFSDCLLGWLPSFLPSLAGLLTRYFLTFPCGISFETAAALDGCSSGGGSSCGGAAAKRGSGGVASPISASPIAGQGCQCWGLDRDTPKAVLGMKIYQKKVSLIVHVRNYTHCSIFVDLGIILNLQDSPPLLAALDLLDLASGRPVCRVSCLQSASFPSWPAE